MKAPPTPLHHFSNMKKRNHFQTLIRSEYEAKKFVFYNSLSDNKLNKMSIQSKTGSLLDLMFFSFVIFIRAGCGMRVNFFDKAILH